LTGRSVFDGFGLSFPLVNI